MQTELTDLIERARALEPVVAAHRTDMDVQRRLPEPVVAGLRELGALRMAVPEDLDGPALDPLTQVALVEELSRQDGSVGWCVMIAAAASYVSGFLQPEAAQRWFGGRDASLAGQLAAVGRAQVVNGGYRVSGRFGFASGSGHASMFLAGCLVHRGEEVARDERGRPLTRSLLLRPEQVTILDTWHTTGLWGTGSHDYTVDDVFVPEADGWDPFGPMHRKEPLYRFPPLFLVPHCGVPLGLAQAALDAFVELAAEKPLYPGARNGKTLAQDPQAQEAVAVAEAKLAAARAYTYERVGELWAVLQRGERVSPKLRATYRIMMTYLHQTAKELISSLADASSTSSIYYGGPIERAQRDIVTACQHRMVHPKVYLPAGRVLLGGDANDPFF
ncbi:MAG: acyl-CoA dehydrogenase family protein [Acidimicrobiales bacterium]